MNTSAYTIFGNALELNDPAARERYVKEACADDADLYERVQKLLHAHSEAGGFFSEPLKDSKSMPVGAKAELPGIEKAGDTIGRYKLLEQIGEGGCGVVYMAEQQEPVRRRVALKVIKLGMDTKQVVARFEAERQALALMDHPNIAKVLDAGATDTGRPYFVMELVRGIRITDFCDRNKLDTAKRLHLFIQICEAIQHAHQKGIIHRDIKPSNILVTLQDGKPVPKVIDFGIAKATTDQRLTDKTLFTAFEQFIGTPAYMSPEQAEMSGLDIDTRSDIYSLGVLLYELLTGKTPFDAKELLSLGIDAMRRTIREQEPPRPSTKLHTLQDEELTTTTRNHGAELPRLIHQLRGDLDWIVMKCLEKDRAQRYDTANGLAMDVQRHLNNEPVVARPHSKFYEFQKTVRRHKVGFAATAAIILVLAAGVVTSTWQAARARRATHDAVAAKRLADESRENEEKLRLRAETNELRAQIAAARSDQVARFMKDMLKGVGPSVALGRDTALLREILDQTAKRLDELTNQPAVEAELRQTLGVVYRNLSDYDNAEAMLQAALAIEKQLYGEKDLHVAATFYQLGQLHHRTRKPADAEADYRQALAVQEELAGHESLEVAATLTALGSLLRFEENREEAEAKLREALALQRNLLPPDHPDVASSISDLGLVLDSLGKLDEAERYLREALTLREKIFPANHPQIADSEMKLADALMHQNRDAEAESNYLAALAIQQQVLGDHRDTVMTLLKLGSLLVKEDRLSEAEQQFREGLAMSHKVLARPSDLFDKLLDVLQREGKQNELITVCQEEVAWRRNSQGEDDGVAAAALRAIADTLRRQPGSLPMAETLYRDALATQRKILPADHLETARTVSGLSDCLIRLGKTNEARQMLEEALAIRRKGTPVDDPAVALMIKNMSNFLMSDDRLAEAIALLDTALKEMPNSRQVLLQLQGFRYRSLAFRQNEPAAAREAFETSSQLFRQSSEHGTRREKAMSLRGQSDNLHEIGLCWERVGKYAAAREAYRRALELDEQIEADGSVRNLSADWTEQHYTKLPDLLERACTGGTRACTPEMALRLARVLGTNEVKLQPASQQALGYCHYLLGVELRKQGYADEANRQFARFEEISRLSVDGGDPGVLNSLAWSLATSVDSNLRAGSNAIRLAEAAVAGTGRTNAMILDTLAAAHAAVGQFPKAIAIQQEAVALLATNQAKAEFTGRLRLYQSGLPFHDDGRLASQAQALLQSGGFAEAEPLARECVALREKMMPDNWLTFNARSLLGGSLLGQKKYAEAEPLLLSGYEGMKQRADKIPAAGKPRLQDARQRLVQLYEQTNRPERAKALAKELEERGPAKTD